ncbi:unnamed protein product [Rotaria sp. Silwood2]|nr:unnamed protein product [Rotaria sp. Silwood2]
MSTTRFPPPPLTTTSYIHLRPQINKKLNYHYDNQHKKKCQPYYKFQTGSTTTFSGYTNINNLRSNKNNNENYYHQQQQQTNKYNINNRQFIYHKKNRRTIARAQQFQNRISTIIRDNIDHTKSFSTLKKFNGLILSDSMCKYTRTEKLSSNQLHVRLSHESGCTCNRMIEFLKQQTRIKNNDIFESNFIVYSLCTNDVTNIGSISAIKKCHELINLTRELFPKLQTIGWIALSPRTKPSRLYNSEEIGNHYHQFNQLLAKLGREMNFDVIYANIQIQHLHIDGLHPSISSGRNLIENALSNWFNKKIIQSATATTTTARTKTTTARTKTTTARTKTTTARTKTTTARTKTTTATYTTYDKDTMIFNNEQYKNSKNVHYNDKNYIQSNENNYNNNNIQLNSYRQRKQKQKHFNQNNNHNVKSDNNQDDQTSKDKLLHIPGKTLILYYPHFLRHREEFFRKIKMPEEFKNHKDEIFHLSNMHFQAEYFKTEAEKWKVYMTAANNKNRIIQQVEPMEIIIEENNNSLPIARPSIENPVDPPAPLDFTDLAEVFDEWLPEPVPGQKRKIGHRRDDPPTPPSPRQPLPPPIIPRRTLPSRDPDQPLTGGSLRISPTVENNNNHKQQRSFNG